MTIPLVRALCFLPLAALAVGCGHASQESVLSGGALAQHGLESSCSDIADSPPICFGDKFSVLAVDTRRRRFLVVWRQNLSARKPATIVGQFVSARGVPGRRVELAKDIPPPGTPLQDYAVSAAFVKSRDEFVLSWSGHDHRRAAASLLPVGSPKRSSWTADNETRARDRNVIVRVRRFSNGSHSVWQEGRLPGSSSRLRVWDGADAVSGKFVR